MNKIFIVIIVLIIGFISIYLLGHDNEIEEISEIFLEEYTSINLDLSPSTPEKK